MSSARTGSAKVCGRTGSGMSSGAGVGEAVDGWDDFCEAAGVLAAAVGEGGEAAAVIGGPDGGPSCSGRLYWYDVSTDTQGEGEVILTPDHISSLRHAIESPRTSMPMQSPRCAMCTTASAGAAPSSAFSCEAQRDPTA